ncbi:unnamed protein product [Prorocentrum cordatum]|uniref:NFACT RNA-binding domain-containing protein n=1 Tax=Prorocentrum cordatum TaxID=2364126 RepID=A0ABN9RHU5_9DINO|nr:unnamed protein product [Polarella glacialis]
MSEGRGRGEGCGGTGGKAEEVARRGEAHRASCPPAPSAAPAGAPPMQHAAVRHAAAPWRARGARGAALLWAAAAPAAAAGMRCLWSAGRGRGPPSSGCALHQRGHRWVTARAGPRRPLGPEAAASGSAARAAGPPAGAAARGATRPAGVGALPPRGFGLPAPAQAAKPPRAPQAGLVSSPPTGLDSISIDSIWDSIRFGIPIWAPISYWRHTILPISAVSTFPDSAADFRRSDSFRSPIRLIDSGLSCPQGCKAVPVASADGSIWQVLLGKGAEENDRLSLEEGRPHETWMHVAGVPGSHAVVRLVSGASERAPPPRDVAEAAASLCAFYSKAKTQPRATVHVTTCAKVGKLPAAAPGQVVLKGGFETMSVRPLSPDQLVQGGAVAASPSGRGSAEAKRSSKRKV